MAKHNKGHTRYADEPWNMTRGLPKDLRSGFAYLPWSRQEAINTDSILRLQHIPHKLYVGKQATEEAFKAFDGNAPSLLHISTHGFMLAALYSSKDSVKQETYKTVLSQSGLLLASANKAWRDFKHGDYNDGILTSNEIVQLDLSKCQLAVLSACRSALGETTNLTGVPFGVAYALKLAGVKQILCSLWSIKDDATSIFMASFYKHLFTTSNAHMALKLAQQDLINSAQYNSPYYWASFVIIE